MASVSARMVDVMKNVFCRTFTLLTGNPMRPKPNDLIVVRGWVGKDDPFPNKFREIGFSNQSTEVAGVFFRHEIEPVKP